jgi:hypothetical protein
LNWQGIRIKAEDIAWIKESVKALEVKPVEIEGLKVLAGQGASIETNEG